jgi:DNA repair exonuclease SbcCD ATPase subunit
VSLLYLQRVELSNFRGYGDAFSVTLPNGPGVTLLSGLNGLGKTTFFDGIEWCLTGLISRLEPHVSRKKASEHLTRIGAPEGSHRVSLFFDDGDSIDRTGSYALPSAEITRRLKQPGWPDIADLDRYLSITHFLGQASTQRFSVKSAREQWEALRGPAGVDRINILKDRIGSQATRMAFTRALRNATADFESADKSVVAWQLLLEGRDRLRRLGVADKADPVRVRTACIELASKLGISLRVAGQSPSDPPAPELFLEELASQTAHRTGIATSRLSNVDGFWAVVTEYQDLAGEIEALEASGVRADDEIQRLQSALDLSIRSAEGALRELGARSKEEGEFQRRSDITSRLLIARETIDDAQVRIDSIDQQTAALDIEIDRRKRQLQDLSTALTRAQARFERRESLVRTISQARGQLEILRRHKMIGERRRALLALGDPVQKLADLKARQDEISARTLHVLEQIDRLNLSVGELRVRRDRVSAAVAAIGAALSQEDTECPICAAHYAPGQLLDLAHRVRESDSFETRELARLLMERDVELLRLSQRDLDNRIDVQKAQAALREIKDLEHLQLSTTSDLAAAGVSEIVLSSETDIDARIASCEREMLLLDAETSSDVSVHEGAEKLEAIQAELTACSVRRANLRKDQLDVMSAIAVSNETLERYHDVWRSSSDSGADLHEIAESTARQLSAAAGAVAEAHSRNNEAQRVVDAQRSQLTQAEAHRNSIRRREESLQERRASVLKEWQNTLPGLPNNSSLLREKERLELEVSRVRDVEMQRQAVAEAFRAWLHDEELKGHEAKIGAQTKELNCTSEEGVSSYLLRKRLLHARQLEDLQRLKEKVDDVVSGLQREADSYSGEVLKPLNASIQQFVRVLLSRADASVVYRAEHYANRSELKPGIVFLDDVDDRKVVEMNPNLYFSEGELSALSVSALFAASTRFRWSRWRALLLDDPLQHTDVIHASAFADLIADLVRHLSYQLIISTHDSTEASFIARKLESAAIPVKICEFLPRGPSGLISEVA